MHIETTEFRNRYRLFTDEIQLLASNVLAYLDTSTSAFADSIWDSSTWRIDHGHKTNKAESFQWKVDIICVEFEALWELVHGEPEVTET